MIVDHIEQQKESWQAFNVEDHKKVLRELQEADLMEIIGDLPCITRIHERDDLHLGTLLTLVSPMWFYMPDVISSAIVGNHLLE